MANPQHQPNRTSYAATAADTIELSFPVLANLTRDGYCRLIYDKANAVIQEQANTLIHRGNVTVEEARQLVEVQRNALVIQMRKPLSPFGRFYSEYLKPANQLPTMQKLLDKKGSVEAVLVSVGKTRAVTNQIALVGRTAGPAGIVLEFAVIGIVIEKAPPENRARVATVAVAGAAAGLTGGTYGMWAGAVAGAAWAGTWAAPSLMIPIVGTVTEGTAIVLGGIIGGILAGWLAHDAAEAATEEVWRLASLEWR